MTVEEYIKINLTTLTSPAKGSTFITPAGEFVDLASKKWSHLDFIKQLVSQRILSKSVLETEEIPELFRKGWIRCNEDAGMGYSYIELRDKEPTYNQYEAIETWVDVILARKKHVTVIFMPDCAWDEQTYGQTVLGSDVVKAIKSAYHRGELLPASAFESLSANEMAMSQKDAESRVMDLGQELVNHIAALLLYRNFKSVHGRVFDHWVNECVNKFCIKIGQIDLKPNKKKIAKERLYELIFEAYGETDDELYDLMDWTNRNYHTKGYEAVDVKIAMKNAFADYVKIGRLLCEMMSRKNECTEDDYKKVIKQILKV